MVGESKLGLAIKYFVLIVFSLIVLFPILIAILGGFKSMAQLRLDLFGLPNPVEWQNYADVLDPRRSKFLRNLFNSTLIMVGTVALELVVCCLAGFALARLKFLGRSLVYNYFLLGLLFPLAVAMMPLYMELKGMHLLNSYWGIILPQVAFGMPWYIMLARGFFMQIPSELEEAATMDGCSHLRFIITIIVPLSTPVLTTIAVLSMVGSWNAFFLPLIVLDNSDMFTLPMGVMAFQGQYAHAWNLILAFLTLAMVPAVVFYIFAQKYIIAGLTGGAVKQ